MQKSSTSATGSVELERGGRRLVLRWWRNRVHFHPRVFNVAIDGYGDASAGEVGDDTADLVGALFAEARAALAVHDPLLMRVTLDEGAEFLPRLQDLGFLLTRSVYVVAIEISELLRVPKDRPPKNLDLVSFEEASTRTSEDELLAVWAEAYGRAARLDPATLDALSFEDRREILLGDPDLDMDLSVCAFLGERLVGVCPAYRSGDARELELGTVGVATPWFKRHSEISLVMLQSAAGHAASRGVDRLLAEVDADSPLSVYLFADLHGRVVESLISLMYVPKWTTAPASEEPRVPSES